MQEYFIHPLLSRKLVDSHNTAHAGAVMPEKKSPIPKTKGACCGGITGRRHRADLQPEADPG